MFVPAQGGSQHIYQPIGKPGENTNLTIWPLCVPLTVPVTIKISELPLRILGYSILMRLTFYFSEHVAPPKKPPRPGAPAHLSNLASLCPVDSYNEGVKVHNKRTNTSELSVYFLNVFKIEFSWLGCFWGHSSFTELIFSLFHIKNKLELCRWVACCAMSYPDVVSFGLICCSSSLLPPPFWY